MKIKPYNKPNLFVLGAGKSGTSTLYRYLNLHPDIFMSKIKEPTFFCEDFQMVKHPIKYFELFNGVKHEKWIGEASHGYLTDPKVPGLIKTLFPDSKFIVIFRNPADRAFSLYQHMRRFRYEKIKTFEKALMEEENRCKSDAFRKNNPQYFHNFLYYRSGQYGTQIQRYLSLFNKDQFLFLTFNDLKENPGSLIEKIWNFLGVSPGIEIPAEHDNKGYQVKLSFLDRFIRSSTLVKSKFISDSKLVNNKIINKAKIKKILTDFNRSPLEKIKPETKEMLMRRYQDDLNLLYELTGIRF